MLVAAVAEKVVNKVVMIDMQEEEVQVDLEQHLNFQYQHLQVLTQ